MQMNLSIAKGTVVDTSRLSQGETRLPPESIKRHRRKYGRAPRNN
jgi:hypothetical protein